MSLLDCLSPARIKNGLKSHWALFLSARKRKAIHRGLPYSLHFETAAICNLRCPECVAGTGRTLRQNKTIPLKIIKEKLELHRQHAFYCNLYFQGEPFLNPELPMLINLAHTARMYSVVATNGHFLSPENAQLLTESGLNRIIISLDGPDKGSHEQYRKGGDFEKVCKGIEQLAVTRNRSKRRRPYIVVQMLVHKGNEDKLDKAVRLVRALGADELQFKSMQIYSAEGEKNFLPGNPRYTRYNTDNTPNKAGHACTRLWTHAVYTSDGLLVPCCYDKVPQHPIGEEENHASALWHSENMKHFRSEVLEGNVPLCRNCKP